MRRLAVFLAAGVLTAGALALLTWRVDPLGEFYDSSATAVAEAEDCLISDDVVGVGSWWEFKRDLVASRAPATIVVGTSRVLMLRGHEGEAFANLGLPGTAPGMLAAFFADIHALADRPLTVYLGVDPFWLNPNWTPPYEYRDEPLQDRIRDLLTRQRIGKAIALTADRPGIVLHPWRRTDIGGRCVLDTADRAREGGTIIWGPDGSQVLVRELLSGLPRKPPEDDFERDLGHLDEPQYLGAYYANWDRLGHLDDLERALELARSYGWTVVGFTPPYSPRYVERLSTLPQTAPRWREFGPVLTELFERYGFTYADTRSGAAMGCADDAYVDDGWHPDPGCARLVRDRLDAAATRSGEATIVPQLDEQE